MKTYSMNIEVTLTKHEDDGTSKTGMVASVHYDDMDYGGVVAGEGCVKAMTDGLYALGKEKAANK